MNKNLKNKIIIATVLGAIIYVIYLALMKIYPFGEYSILKCDLYQQYVNFLCYLRQIILNGKSILFSWNLGLGNNFFTTFAYYLMSPLNIGVVLFSPQNMDLFVEILTGIKIILAIDFAIIYLEKVYKYKEIEVVLFGLMYGYSSYVMCYSFHIMWLDCVYMLPLTLLFVDEYIQTKKIYKYIIALTYSILTNYYMGYIVALFSGIYYIAKYFLKEKNNNFAVKEFVKNLFKFIIGICISFGIGMIVILPSMIQLSSKMSANTKIIEFSIEKIRLFINVIFNNYVYMFTQKSCFVFSSTICILLLPLYYLNPKIKVREKIVFTGIVVFLMLPIISPFLNKMWHAFTVPNCFNYRYSFTLIFTIIVMCFREYQNKNGTNKKNFLISLEIFTILTLIEYVFLKKGYLESEGYTVSIKSIIISCVIYIAIFITTYCIYFNVGKKKWIKLVLIVILVIDLMIGAKSGQNNNDKYIKRSVWIQYDNVMEYLMSKIDSPETERIIFMPDKYGSNMSLKYGYSNIGFFSSARNRETLKSMYRLGYNVQMEEQLWITSYSGTFLNYCIAGVKYYVSREPLNDSIYGFEFDSEYDGFYIYKNKNSFNIGYYVSKNIEESYNPFKMQNDLLNAIGEKDLQEDIYFKKVENSKIINCSRKELFDDGEYRIIYKIEALKDCSIYVQSDYNLQISLEGKELFKDYSNIWSTETGIKQIKNLKQGEKTEFILKTKNNVESIYVSDDCKIQEKIDKMNKTNYISDIRIKNNGLECIANYKDDGLLCFSINYDNMWRIYVDGIEKEIIPICGAFLGVEVDKGAHKIEIK